MKVKEYKVVVDDNLNEWWYNKDGQLHREDDKPAVICSRDGTEIWYKNGLRHRDNGPAFVRRNETQEWIKNGKLHREDGPAVIRREKHYYYFEGKEFANMNDLKEFKQIINIFYNVKHFVKNKRMIREALEFTNLMEED